MTRRVLIMGAAGRDFHNFNTVYRSDPGTEVVAFTATQIPFINDRTYPASLAGPRYPNGIKIYDESELSRLIREMRVDDVVFSYSDVSHEYVMHKASQAMSCGANFVLPGPAETMLDATVPVVSVCAVRTGSGKSQTTRAVAGTLKEAGKRVVAVRHPMPYGDLEAQRVQRYATIEDLQRYDTTIEEREEYEPHIVSGTVIYAGVDYGDILAQAQAECDVLIWDGGNNDLPFYRPTIAIVVGRPAPRRSRDDLLPRRDEPAHGRRDRDQQDGFGDIRTDRPARAHDRGGQPERDGGASQLGCHGGRSRSHRGQARAGDRGRPHAYSRRHEDSGAGVVAARRGGAAEIVDPRPWAVGTIEETFRKYDVGPVLPAMGYSEGQLAEMEKIIDAADVDLVVIGTPIDLRRVITISKPAVRVRYDLEVRPGSPTLLEVLAPVL